MPGNEKTNPNVAMLEATPQEAWQNSGMAPNYVPYISKDLYGNEIAEPDLSNPTRSRHERPLDTIRSFEAAAYGKEYISGGDVSSESGMFQRGESRQSLSYDHHRRSSARAPSVSAYSTNQMQRNYSYGNMTAELDDGASDVLQSPIGASRPSAQFGGPSTPRANGGEPSYYQQQQQASAANWDSRHGGYGSPVSDSGRAQFAAPAPQRLNYAAPPTPPQDGKTAVPTPQKEKKSWGKRLSFGKNKA